MFEQIKLIANNTLIHYLNEVLDKSPQEKHDQIKNMFDLHMNKIAQYCIDEFVNKDTLSEKWIKWLHKILYPAWYTQTTDIENTRWKVVYMIPWEYKSINNKTVNYINPEAEDIEFLEVNKVKESMDLLIMNFNNKPEKNKDVIMFFVLDFLEIHPFGDGNWRIASILVDVLCLKNGIKPFYFYLIKEKDLTWLYKSIQLAKRDNDLSYIYEVVDRLG